MRVACLLMQKNERRLLEPWIAYHSALFGLENLFVFDNGSVDPVVIEILELYRARGLNVDYSFHTRADFEGKGSVIARTIQNLDAGEAPCDFHFPLDCDEFVVVGGPDDGLVSGKTAVEQALQPYLNDKRVLTVSSRYRNSPLHPDRYLPGETNKCFFARGTCRSLDTGYHLGRAVDTDEQVKTPIVYVELRFRPYREYQFFARQKLRERVGEFTKSRLRAHKAARGAGNHLVDYVLMSQEEYLASFSDSGRVYFPELRRLLSDLGAPIDDAGEAYPLPEPIPEGGIVGT